jgi:aryl-alcohol dehydrogenase-like predicted oxidoreductase
MNISKISFGTAQLHHIYSSRVRQSLLGTAASIGITHFDTSPYYGYGLAEIDIGRFISSNRNKYTVATKIGIYPTRDAVNQITQLWMRKISEKIGIFRSGFESSWCLQRAKKSVEESMKRLQTDYLDAVFFHEPDIRLIASDEFIYWLENEKRKGKILNWGVAGEYENIKPLMQNEHFSKIIQTRCSDNRNLNYELSLNKRQIIKYGCLTGKALKGSRLSPSKIIYDAIKANPGGSIIISSRDPMHINEFANLL